MAEKLHHVVVVGGGAGGLELATKLGDKLGRRKKAVITLVDASPTHLWKPLLHEVAAGTLNSNIDELNYLSHARNHHFRFRLGAADGLDRERRRIHIAATSDRDGHEIMPARELEYDTLVFAVGSVTNDFGVPGVREHCLFLDTREQADRFHQRLLARFFNASAQGQEAAHEGRLDVAIAGAGATGVELAAELRTALQIMARHTWDRTVPDHHVKFTLIEAADRVLPALPPKISASVETLLDSINVDVLLGERIVEVDAGGLRTASGRYVPAETKVWAAGIRAPGFLANLAGLETNHINQLMVRPTLQTTRDDDIFALGDCACVPQKNAARPVPPRAQSAHQQASMLVRSIQRRLREQPLPEYVYKDYGSLINLSRFETIGSLMGSLMRRRTGSVMIEGWLARMAYMSLYKMHQQALHGTPWVLLSTLASQLTRAGRPKLKLH